MDIVLELFELNIMNGFNIGFSFKGNLRTWSDKKLYFVANKLYKYFKDH